MARLPTPGSDTGNWGDILNDFLSQAQKPDGTLKDHSVGAAQLANDAVTNAQLANNSVTSAQLASSSVQTVTLVDGAVTTPKIADASATAAKFAPGVIPTTVTVADGSVTTAKLADNAVTNPKVDIATQASLSKADSSSQPGHGHVISDVINLQTTLDGKQPTGSYVSSSRTVAGHPLTADVTITPADIGAATTAQGTKADGAIQPGSLATVATTGAYADLTGKPSLGNVSSLNVGTTTGTVAAGDDARITSSVPATRTVAGHDLTADVTITPADIGAATAAQGTIANNAMQPTQLASTTKRIAGMTYFYVWSRSFPALIRPPEQGRGRLIIRNMGVNNVNIVVPGRNVANYNSPGWTGSISLGAGKELVADNASTDLFIGPDADGTIIKVKVYAEVSL